MSAFDLPTANDVTPEQWRTWSEESKEMFRQYWGSRGIAWLACLGCGFPTACGVSACESCSPRSER